MLTAEKKYGVKGRSSEGFAPRWIWIAFVALRPHDVPTEQSFSLLAARWTRDDPDRAILWIHTGIDRSIARHRLRKHSGRAGTQQKERQPQDDKQTVFFEF